jgi:hypothetical protein
MTGTRVDRAALVQRAMVELVAETGIQGATMGASAWVVATCWRAVTPGDPEV